jgi:acetyl/propionyl-CoA carboxylase alpha subunit
VGGIRTNTRFFLEILADEGFRAGEFSTAFLEQFFEKRQVTRSPAPQVPAPQEQTLQATRSPALHEQTRQATRSPAPQEPALQEAVAALVASMNGSTPSKEEVATSNWARLGRKDMLR